MVKWEYTREKSTTYKRKERKKQTSNIRTIIKMETTETIQYKFLVFHNTFVEFLIANYRVSSGGEEGNIISIIINNQFLCDEVLFLLLFHF